jgi:fructose-1,6-bisphosphatase II / sedoheptulose-1,7-bisphosphatase
MSQATEFHDRMLSLGLARVSEAAAIACADHIGRGDEKAADQAAVDAMRKELNKLDITGVVVIGEGERDEAPMLYIGEQVGSGEGPAVDIALDPLEGTTLCAKDMPNALAVIAMGPRGSMLHAPDVYMDKVAIGPGYKRGAVTLAMTPSERVSALAAAKGCSTRDITVCVLDRPRHAAMIAEIRSLKCMGGQIFGKLIFRNDDERARARKAGITNFDRVYTRDDMVTGDVIFAATGVTDGSLLPGIRREVGHVTAETILMRSKTGSVRRMTYRNPVR